MLLSPSSCCSSNWTLATPQAHVQNQIGAQHSPFTPPRKSATPFHQATKGHLQGQSRVFPPTISVNQVLRRFGPSEEGAGAPCSSLFFGRGACMELQATVVSRPCWTHDQLSPWLQARIRICIRRLDCPIPRTKRRG